MIASLTLLIACQFVGEIAVHAAHLPVPGPVLGLLLMLGILTIQRGPRPAMRELSDNLLRNMALLFVPAGVGVVTQLDVLARNWLPVACALVVSTALGLLTTALVMQFLAASSAGEP